MLIAIPPKYAVSQVIGFIKGKSAIHVARVYGERRRNFTLLNQCPALRISTKLRLKPGADRHHGKHGRGIGGGLIPGKRLNCVLLADRHHGLTEGVRGLLATAFGSVVMVADEGSLIEGAGRLQPEVAVVDLSLARDAGLGWLQALRQRCPDLKVIVLSVHDEQSVRRAAMEAGADAFVLKRAIATELLSAVDAVRGGRSAEASAANTRSP